MSDVAVRRIEPADLSAVAELERLCFAEPWSAQALELLLGEGAVGMVAVANGTVVAYGGMMTVADEGQITNIAVHPSYRRRGLGRAIVESLLSAVVTRGVSAVFLEVRVSNVAAIALYRGLGFEIAGTRKRFYKLPTEDAYVMKYEEKRAARDENASI